MADYAITADGTALSTYCDFSRFLKYSSGRRRGGNPTVPYRDGEWSDPVKYYTGSDILLEVGIKPATAHDNLSAVSGLLGSTDSLVLLSYTDPDRGALRAYVELMDEPQPTQNRFVYLFPMHNPSGMWEDVSASTASAATPPVVTTGGDRPISDMVLTFSGPGYLEHTRADGVKSRITIDAGAGAGTYVVDVGDRTVTKASVNQDAYLTITQEWWMRFTPGESQTLASDVNVAVSWRNKWA